MDPGSSPRLRGTLQNLVISGNLYRFIPASAGNTLQIVLRHPSAPVHPRVCGEHSLPRSGFRAVTGSSPRLRGTLGLFWMKIWNRRFIPASAGNTSGCQYPSDGIPVHPRVCGEHSGSFSQLHDNSGSSPRLRGTLASSSAANVADRFIPASAGNTAPRCAHTTR